MRILPSGNKEEAESMHGMWSEDMLVKVLWCFSAEEMGLPEMHSRSSGAAIQADSKRE